MKSIIFNTEMVKVVLEGRNSRLDCWNNN